MSRLFCKLGLHRYRVAFDCPWYKREECHNCKKSKHTHYSMWEYK